MYFPAAAQVINAIRIPNDAIALGRMIERFLRFARIANRVAINARPENIREPVSEPIAHSLTITHSSLKTKPKVVFSLLLLRNPKKVKDRVERAVSVTTPLNLFFSTLDRTRFIRSSPSKLEKP
jgi:hypothetical protein